MPVHPKESTSANAGARGFANTLMDTLVVCLLERHLGMDVYLEAWGNRVVLLEMLDVCGERGSSGPIPLHEVKLAWHFELAA